MNKTIRELIVDRLRMLVEDIDGGASSKDIANKYCELSTSDDEWGCENNYVAFGRSRKDIIESIELAEREEKLLDEIREEFNRGEW